MANFTLNSPLSRLVFRPLMSDWDQDFSQISASEGLDVYEEDDVVVIKASVPGIPAEKVEVEYENGVLHIHARPEETQEQREKKKVVYRQDRVRSFDYSTTLPRTIDPKSIEAVTEDGVVRITAKISEEAMRKRIPVKTAVKK
jgi:HSP20 family protein